MSVYQEKSRSCWMEDAPPSFPALAENATADVAVIGGGIAGLSTAYELAKAGHKVIVIDRGPIARGMTARTSAHLTSACDDFYYQFIKIRGEDIARLHFESHADAIERIGTIAALEGIACDYKRLEARLFLAGDAKEDVLDREKEALTKVGLAGVGKRSVMGGHRLSDGPCLIIPGQGRFHPTRYLDGLARSLTRLGAQLHADTVAAKVSEEQGTATIQTADGHAISAAAVVIATNGPIDDHGTVTRQEVPFRTYVLAAEVPKGAIEDVLYWDTEEPYHYVRLHPSDDGHLLLVGGEDHRSGEADDADERFQRLTAWARERFPEMGRERYRWSGQCLDTPDYAAFIGKRPGSNRVFLASGDSGQGITHGVVAGLLLADLIDSDDHPWAPVYDPARKPPKSIPNLLGGAAGAAKNLLQKVAGGGDVASEAELIPGAGGVIRSGADKLAVCRDENGKVHRFKDSCTHAGCGVRWNSFEQCWDCPCHGSQFAPDGTALNAPAVKPLAPAPTPAAKEKAASES